MTANLSKGVCHGFEIQSHLPHQFLHPGRGEPLLVEEIEKRTTARGSHLITWPGGSGRLEISLFQMASEGFEVNTASLGVIEVDLAARKIGVPRGAGPLRREMLTFGPPAALLIAGAGDLAFHGAAFGLGERAIVITGPGGSGKSTLTAAALSSGWPVLTDDLCRLTITDEVSSVHPGPAVVRLRDGSLSLLDLSSTRVAGHVAGKTHFVTSVRDGPAPQTLPIGAIALLSRAPVGSGVGAQRLAPEAALPLLWRQSFFLPDEAQRKACFESLAALVDRVPVFRFEYPHQPESIDESLQVLCSLVGSR